MGGGARRASGGGPQDAWQGRSRYYPHRVPGCAQRQGCGARRDHLGGVLREIRRSRPRACLPGRDRERSEEQFQQAQRKRYGAGARARRQTRHPSSPPLNRQRQQTSLREVSRRLRCPGMTKTVLLLRIGSHRWYVPAAIVGASRMIRFALFPVLLLAFPGTAPEADVAAGQAAFARCKICHSVNAGATSQDGPNLYGVLGRKDSTLEGYSYSEAMKNSGIVWDDETLTKYLRDPRGSLPGNKMAFPGIKSDEEVPNLLAYLHQATQ